MWATSHRHVAISGVSLRLDKPARRPSKAVASACLFRHARSDAQKLEVYVGGLEKAAADIRTLLPEWNLRIYLDASIYDAQDNTLARIHKLHEAHDHVEIFAATCDLAECGSKGSTFLPSLWRFLAGLDASVDAFLCIDADASLNPLVAHVASTEWLGTPQKYMFVALSGYNPPWCALNAFEKAAFGDANDCPISGGWGGKKQDGDDTIMPPDLWGSLVKAIQDPDMKAYGLLRRKVADALMSAMKRDPEYMQLRLSASKSSQSAPQFLDGIVGLTQRALSTLEGSEMQELKDMFKRRPDMLRFHALRENRLFWDAMPLSVSSSMPSSGWAVAQQNKSIKCAEDADDILDGIATQWDYGVDEWLLHKILVEAKKINSVYALETPSPQSCGVEFHPQIRISRQSDLPYPIAAIKALANDRWQDQNIIEVASRFLLIAFAARASSEDAGGAGSIWGTWVAAYVQRAFAPFADAFRTAGVDQAMFAGAFEESFVNDAAAWLQLWKRFAFVLDKQALVNALGGPEAAAVDKGVVSCKSEAALRGFLRLLCAAAFMNMSMFLALGSVNVPGLAWY